MEEEIEMYKDEKNNNLYTPYVRRGTNPNRLNCVTITVREGQIVKMIRWLTQLTNPCIILTSQ
jgi:hypothetical protein